MRGHEADIYFHLGYLRRLSCFWAFCQINCGLCCTCLLLNFPFIQSCSSTTLIGIVPERPHPLPISILAPVSWGTWSLLAFVLLWKSSRGCEDWLTRELDMGNGRALTLSCLLGMYVLLTIVDPWTTAVWTVQVHLYTDFFFNTVRHIPRFWIYMGFQLHGGWRP